MTSDTLIRVQRLVQNRELRISEHGYDELAEDGISVADILGGVAGAEAIEDYPDYPKGASVLVLQFDSAGHPIHVVWGIPKGYTRPAVLVTAYRPNPQRWRPGFKERQR